MHPKISIIIPCYNLGEYLDGCLLSIQKQPHTQEVEYIFINDGSTDNTLLKLQNFCKERSNCTLINQPNKGVSTARNNALGQVRGDYIYLLDGDDKLTENAIKKMLSSISDSPDLVLSQHYEEDKNITHKVGLTIKNGKYGLIELLKNKSYFPISTKILYKRSILTAHDTHFNPNLTLGEVFEFTCRALIHSTTIKVIPDSFFVYVRRDEGSATRSVNYSRDLSITKTIESYNIILGELFEEPLLQSTILKILMSFTYNKYAKLCLWDNDLRYTLSNVRQNVTVRNLLKKSTKNKNLTNKDRFLAGYFLYTGISGYRLLIKIMQLIKKFKNKAI